MTIEEAIKGHSHLSQQDYDSLVRDAMLWRNQQASQQEVCKCGHDKRIHNVACGLCGCKTYQASQPAEAQEIDRELNEVCASLSDYEAEQISKYIERVRKVAFQRGQQSMAEKAVQQVCAEILDIMRVYHEQENRPEGVDTPGGLEHMGDVWSLFLKWESSLAGAEPQPPQDKLEGK